ncbi:MAG: hypothetical protein WC307_05010 [Candidatus Nanoarchaeia archaeon]|jgi:hypothetical protein
MVKKVGEKKMNQRDVNFQRNSAAKLLNFSDSRFRNCIRFSSEKAESDAHFSAKCVICRELCNMGFEFVTEARFLNKSRADIFVLDKSLAIEVLVSEKESNVTENKACKYPVYIEYLKLNESMTVNSIKKWLEDVLN